MCMVHHKAAKIRRTALSSKIALLILSSRLQTGSGVLLRKTQVASHPCKQGRASTRKRLICTPTGTLQKLQFNQTDRMHRHIAQRAGVKQVLQAPAIIWQQLPPTTTWWGSFLMTYGRFYCKPGIYRKSSVEAWRKILLRPWSRQPPASEL